MSIYYSFLLEGRGGGHIHHPYEFVHTGEELVGLFRRIATNMNDPQYLKQHVSLKVDGVNAIFKLVHNEGEVQWAFDGGSAKGEDVRGVTTGGLDARFGEHRPIYFQALNTMNRLLPYIGTNLRELGLEAENQKGFMCDINMPGTTNVVDYATQFPFITIHDVVQMKEKPESKKGAREAVEVSTDVELLRKTIAVMDGMAQKRGWRIFSGVGVSLKENNIDISAPLRRKITIGKETKPLEKWLEGITIDHKQVNLKNYTKMIHKEQMTKAEHDGALIFLVNMLVGQHMLNGLKSSVLSPSEGIVIRDSRIANGKIKITGNFMVNRTKSPFAKKVTEAVALPDLMDMDPNNPKHLKMLRDQKKNKKDVIRIATGYKFFIPPEFENDVDAPKNDDGTGGSMLARACSYGAINLVDALIKAGADVNLKDNYGVFPLMKAVSMKRIDIVMTLLEAGADVNAMNNDGSTALNYAGNELRTSHPLYNSSLDRIRKLLIQYGANP